MAIRIGQRSNPENSMWVQVCNPQSVSVDEIIKSDVRSIMDSVLCKVDGLCAKSMGAKQQAGKTWHAYSAQFKADVIHAYDEPGTTQHRDKFPVG